MTDTGKVFKPRMNGSCLQCFKEHLHLPLLNIPMHLQKVVIHQMVTEFGIGCNLTKKLEQIPPKLRTKRRSIDVRVKVWKDLVKAYGREDA